MPPAWRALDPGSLSGTLLLLGDTDSGKTTFARWLVGELVRAGRRVAWLDGDAGQPALGPPTTLSLSLPVEPWPPSPAVEASFFVGSTSPRGHMLPTVVGTHRLRELALARGAEVVVVDTSGLVAEAAGGGALKLWKIELLRPTTVVALQVRRELAHLVGPLARDPRTDLRVLPVCEQARTRSREERAARRKELFRGYFSGAAERELPLVDIPVYGFAEARPGRLLALLDRDGFTAALAVTVSLQPGALRVLSPLRDTTAIAGLRFGSLSLDPFAGEEST